MSKPNAADDLPAGEAAASTGPATTLRHPVHGVLDTIEVAAEDEVLHDAALRDSALRPPR
jgi:hypothetical protein